MATLDSHTNLKSENVFFLQIVDNNVSDTFFSNVIDGRSKEGMFLNFFIRNTNSPSNLTINSIILEHADENLVFSPVPSKFILDPGFTNIPGIYVPTTNLYFKINYIGTKRFTRFVTQVDATVAVVDAGEILVYSSLSYEPFTKNVR